MKITILLLLSLLAPAQTSRPAGDPQHLLPTTLITINSTDLSAHKAYLLVAKLLGVEIQLAPSNVRPIKLSLHNVYASEALDAIAEASHQTWEAWPNPNGRPVLVVVKDSQ